MGFPLSQRQLLEREADRLLAETKQYQSAEGKLPGKRRRKRSRSKQRANKVAARSEARLVFDN